ncbi:MAG: signal peptidase I [Thermoproteus sp.]|jgi:signal peptidase
MGETEKWVQDIFVFAVILFAVFLAAKYILRVSWPFAVVSSWSMMPDLRVGDFVVLTGAGSCPHVGDIIVYVASPPFPPGEWIIHRVIAVGPGCSLATKGDNSITNPISDQQYGEPPVTPGDIIGKAMLVVPYIGVFPLIVRPQSAAGVGLWLMRLGIFLMLIAAYYAAFKWLNAASNAASSVAGIDSKSVPRSPRASARRPS